MENKCLVTELKGTVNNENLPVLGEMVIHFNSTGENHFSINGTSGNIKVKNNVVKISRGGTEAYSLPFGGDKIIFPAGEYDILIDNKYGLSWLYRLLNNSWTFSGGFSFNLDDLKYAEGLTRIQFYHNASVVSGGSLESLAGKSITEFGISGNFGGSLGAIANSQSAIAGVMRCRGTEVTGDINAIVTMPTFIDGTLTSVFLDTSKVSGDIQSFVNAAIAAGVTTRTMTLTMTGANTNVIVGTDATTGQIYKTSTFIGTSQLKWGSASKWLYTRGGNVTDLDDSSKRVFVYVKGYSSSEVQELESNNNVVTVLA